MFKVKTICFLNWYISTYFLCKWEKLYFEQYKTMRRKIKKVKYAVY